MCFSVGDVPTRTTNKFAAAPKNEVRSAHRERWVAATGRDKEPTVTRDPPRHFQPPVASLRFALSLLVSAAIVTAALLPTASFAVSGGGLDYANLDITGMDFSKGNYKGKDFTQGTDERMNATLGRRRTPWVHWHASTASIPTFRTNCHSSPHYCLCLPPDASVIAKTTNFAGSNLQGCRFFKAYLVKANFEGSDLRGASLEDTSMDGANLRNAIASGAYFSTSILDTESVENADFTDAQVRRSQRHRRAHLPFHATMMSATSCAAERSLSVLQSGRNPANV
jgi:uncharacterized protein YjbI with pentapeptide repeats